MSALVWVAFGLAYLLFALVAAGLCGFNDIEDDT